METFKELESTMTPVIIDNIDTDQIIPARFLKLTTREGFGDHLFKDWRFDSNDKQKEDFPLNQSKYSGKILFSGDNFGCGSSREHAAWAIFDYGFRVVIARSFADIFKNNALNNGILPIEVSSSFHEHIKENILKNPHCEAHIDLESETVTIEGKMEKFQINPFKKICLLQGKDEFTYLVELKDEIENFENTTRKK